MRAVNLLPKDARGGRSLTSQQLPAVVGAGVGFVVVAALAGGYLSASSKVKTAQGDLTAAQTQLAQTPVPPTPQVQVNTAPNAVSSEQAPRLQAVSAVLSQRIAWDRVLREFSLVLPNDVWILSMSLTAPTGGAANGFTVTGSTYSYDSVARMLTRMYLVPDLTGVTLGSVGGGSDNIVQFSINASIKGAAAPATPTPAPAPAAPATTDTTSTDSGTSP